MENKPYWASVPSKEISDEILDRVDKYYKFLSATGRMDRYRRSYAYYYRTGFTGARLNPAGEQGELTTISVNSYRNYLTHIAILTTQQQVYFEPQASNSDVESQSQVILASSLLEYYLKEKKMERNMIQAVDDCLIFDEGFVRVQWDPSGGKTYGRTATGAIAYEGDLKYTNYTPLDVIRDFTKKSSSDLSWCILRDIDRNKFDLAAKYPDIAEDILSDSNNDKDLQMTCLNYLGIEDTDNITVYTLLHAPTPAMPNGRYVECLNNGTILIDGPLPYRETHVYRIAPGEQSGTIFGYTVGYDLMPIQEAQDILNSTILTNQATHGVQNILVPKGSDLSTSQIAGGLSIMEYDPKVGEPKAFQVTSTPPEIFNYLKMLEQSGDVTSGINSVAKGQPDASLKSGTALALIQTMAIQYNMGLQRSYAQLGSDIGTGTINILQDYASVPRIAEIVGKSNRPQMKEWTGADLGSIARVTVNMGNPLQRTTAGKVNLADAYLEKGMIKNPDQYVQVVTTGRLEPIIEGAQKQLLLIKGENENLSDGMEVRALITDDHGQHILEHSSVLADPNIRNDPNNPIVINTLNHIQEHMDMWTTMPPGMAALLKHQIPFTPDMAPPPMPGAIGAGEQLNPEFPVDQPAEANLPTDPMTGETVNLGPA